jgi:Lycopene cyclase
MIPEHYIWLTWSLAFMLPWAGLFWAFPRHRRAMWWSSLFTMPFGLTEPLFVPEYWNPPSLFDLAQRTGFDVESLIFCFGIGGVGVVLYNVLTGHTLGAVPAGERHQARHRFHRYLLILPFAVFIVLYWLPWNPIYPGILAMLSGAVTSMWCRPDLVRKSWVGGLLFLGYYLVFLVGLQITAPGYIDRVWNHAALTGIRLFGMPTEELLFAFGFGLYWSSVYEHFTWKRVESA